jgi:hypothetical protein
VKRNLTGGEKADLVTFLQALDGAQISLTVPTAFPQ